MASTVLSRHYINEEVEHVALGQGGGYVTPLQGSPLIVLGVNPCTHGEFCDEDVAAFGEKDGSLS